MYFVNAWVIKKSNISLNYFRILHRTFESTVLQILNADHVMPMEQGTQSLPRYSNKLPLNSTLQSFATRRGLLLSMVFLLSSLVIKAVLTGERERALRVMIVNRSYRFCQSDQLAASCLVVLYCFLSTHFAQPIRGSFTKYSTSL